MPIIASDCDLQVGSVVVTGVIHVDNESYSQRFLVLRVATYEEYVNWVKSQGSERPAPLSSKFNNYYEISLD